MFGVDLDCHMLLAIIEKERKVALPCFVSEKCYAFGDINACGDGGEQSG